MGVLETISELIKQKQLEIDALKITLNILSGETEEFFAQINPDDIVALSLLKGDGKKQAIRKWYARHWKTNGVEEAIVSRKAMYSYQYYIRKIRKEKKNA